MPGEGLLGSLRDCYDRTDTRVNKELVDQLKGQNVVIAGAGRGVGRAAAELFSYAAKSLSLVALEQDEVDETGKICQNLNPGVQINCHAFDVCDPAAVHKFLDNVVLRFGSIDTLVMNAGRPPQWLPTAEGDPDIWWRTVEVSLRGAYNFSRYGIPYMQKQSLGGGCIIFTSSLGAHKNEGMSSYTVGKLGMVRLAEIIHVENYHQHNIKAFAIHPGAIPTRFFHDFKNMAEGKTDDLRYISATAEGEDKSAQNAIGLLGEIEWDTPYLAGGMMTVLASGQLDFLSGRYVDCTMRVEDLVSRKDATLEDDLYRVRLNAGEGVLMPRSDY
jgi:NAD(P)-dependent dehydrogenase (short-subunit alcohol dehydrogenase family)